VFILREAHTIRNIHIGRNTSTGGFGFFTSEADRFDSIFCYQNVIRDHDQGSEWGNYVGTLFWIGGGNELTNYKINKTIRIEHNEAYNIISRHSHTKENASVFCDVRECTNVSLSYNVMEDLVNTANHSDANAMYAKADSMAVRGCVFKNCGANSGGNMEKPDIGSEGGCITFKGYDAAKGNILRTLIEGCTFIAGDITEVRMILTSHETIIRNCTFQDWQYDGTHPNRDAMIGTYSGGKLTIENPTVINCGVKPGHSAYAVKKSGGDSVICRNWQVDFDNNRTDIFYKVNRIENCCNTLGEPMQGNVVVATSAHMLNHAIAPPPDLAVLPVAVFDGLGRLVSSSTPGPGMPRGSFFAPDSPTFSAGYYIVRGSNTGRPSAWTSVVAR